jgi:hypothetical protein
VSLVEIDRRFRGSYCLHHQGDDIGGSKHIWMFIIWMTLFSLLLEREEIQMMHNGNVHTKFWLENLKSGKLVVDRG